MANAIKGGLGTDLLLQNEGRLPNKLVCNLVRSIKNDECNDKGASYTSKLARSQ